MKLSEFAISGWLLRSRPSVVEAAASACSTPLRIRHVPHKSALRLVCIDRRRFVAQSHGKSFGHAAALSVFDRLRGDLGSRVVRLSAAGTRALQIWSMTACPWPTVRTSLRPTRMATAWSRSRKHSLSCGCAERCTMCSSLGPGQLRRDTKRPRSVEGRGRGGSLVRRSLSDGCRSAAAASDHQSTEADERRGGGCRDNPQTAILHIPQESESIVETRMRSRLRENL